MDDSTKVCRVCGHPHYVRRALPNICYGIDITDYPLHFDWQDPRMGFMPFDVCRGCGIVVERWESWAVSLSEFYSKHKQENNKGKTNKIKHKPLRASNISQKCGKIIHFITKAEKEKN